MWHSRGKAALVGFVASAILGILIFVGSNNLKHVDAVLLGYTFATLFAMFGISYRYSMWLQRPPTQMYWRRGWSAFFKRGNRRKKVGDLANRLVRVFAINEFIWRRSWSRGLTHSLIMWGCLMAAGVTFPLVFGWVHFETLPNDLTQYVVYAFGFPTTVFPIHSLFGFLLFHALVWASLLVIAGVLMALRRRLRDHGAAALQDFQEDLLPLFLLFAVSVTGLMLTASYTWMKGYAYEFLAIFHAITVIFTLLWLPFGKFFHIFQRPAQIGVKFYQDSAKQGEQALCARCQEPFASKLQIDDLIVVESQLGYRYESNETDGHYQHVCPACRRKNLALAQGKIWVSSTRGA